MVTPRVNPEIWSKLNHSAKQNDLRVCSTQKSVNLVGAILAKSMQRRYSVCVRVAVCQTLTYEWL